MRTKNHFQIVIVCFSIIGSVNFVHAQESLSQEAWSENLSKLMDSVEKLISENERITNENTKLVDQVNELTRKVGEVPKNAPAPTGQPQDVQQNIDTSAPPLAGLSVNPEQAPGFGSTSLTIPSNHPERKSRDRPGTVEWVDEEGSSSHVLKDDVSYLSDQIAAAEKDISSLKEKLANAGTPVDARPADFQGTLLNELKARKEELTLDLNLKKESQENHGKELEQEIQDLQKQRDDVLKQKIETAQQIKKLSKKSSVKGEDQRVKLSEDIRCLEKELSRLQIEKKLTSNNMTQKERVEQESFSDLVEKKMDRQALLDHNEKLQQDIAELQQDRTLENISLKSLPEEDQTLRDQVHELGQKNDLLAKELTDLNFQVSMLEKEITLADSMMPSGGDPQMSDADNADRKAGQVLAKDLEGHTVAEMMAYSYASQKMYPQAVEKYLEAIDKGGNKKDIYFNLGTLYYRMGNLSKAVESFENVLEIDPKDGDASSNLKQLKEKISRNGPKNP